MSVSSPLPAEKPHARYFDLPDIINGIPGIVAPIIPPFLSSNLASDQYPGAVRLLCGSAANKLDLLDVLFGCAAQTFDAGVFLNCPKLLMLNFSNVLFCKIFFLLIISLYSTKELTL